MPYLDPQPEATSIPFYQAFAMVYPPPQQNEHVIAREEYYRAMEYAHREMEWDFQKRETRRRLDEWEQFITLHGMEAEWEWVLDYYREEW